MSAVPTLGICLGMQLLTRGSEEGSCRPRLGRRGGTPIPPRDGLKVPHMGWNRGRETRESPLTAGLPDDARFYFVHSLLRDAPTSRRLGPDGGLRRALRRRDRSGKHLRRPVPPGEEPQVRHAAARELRGALIVLRPRVIPTLLLRDESLVKTVRFGRFATSATRRTPSGSSTSWRSTSWHSSTSRRPSTAARRTSKLLADIADECFMPLAYGGGIRTFDQARAMLGIGFEKVIVNSHAVEDPAFVTRLADHFGSQAVIASIDVSATAGDDRRVWARSGRADGLDPVEWAAEMEATRRRRDPPHVDRPRGHVERLSTSSSCGRCPGREHSPHREWRRRDVEDIGWRSARRRIRGRGRKHGRVPAKGHGRAGELSAPEKLAMAFADAPA